MNNESSLENMPVRIIQRNCVRYLKNQSRIFHLVLCLIGFLVSYGQEPVNSLPEMRYTVSFPEVDSNTYHVELITKGWKNDTLNLKLPQWTPGYYQIMNYYENIAGFIANDSRGTNLKTERVSNTTYMITGVSDKQVRVQYTVKTKRKFVANSYVDTDHAYIIPANSFFYSEDHMQLPVSIKINLNSNWNDIVTGLDPIPESNDEFIAPNFDILFDCPILIGNLEELPSFFVHGKQHRFIGHDIGNFDKIKFMSLLKSVVEAAVNIIGHIPYNQYSFIAIGKGRGGIEHLNNTTISFNGDGLKDDKAMKRMMNFLAHEYFHHYNVKRIRPFELGPFDYEYGSKTSMLWLSEGFSVYYEYIIVKRAGLIGDDELTMLLANHINQLENNPGRYHQSLVQASYNTWIDGPFGTSGKEPDRSISVYQKGPIIGFLLDIAIRGASNNQKSLDDVMRFVYKTYYLEKQRGFTDTEFMTACELMAGKSLTQVFEYVYTTKEINYNNILSLAGLELIKTTVKDNNVKTRNNFVITRIKNPQPIQSAILNSWLGH